MQKKNQDQPLFIQCANGNYPILVNPKPSFAEQLTRIKINAGVHKGLYTADYQEFCDRLTNLLIDIIDSKILRESEHLRYFTSMRKAMDYKVKGGILTEEWMNGEIYDPVQLTPVLVGLIDFLHNPRKLKKLKRCPFCQKFFIAKDAKREKCYANKCFKEYKRIQKQRQREDDPVKYI